MPDAPQPDSPTAPRSIWTRPARGGRGPRPEHSLEEIAAAAVALADSGGLSAVTMRAVAAELGTGAGSLYRYLSSRDDLLSLMSDAAVAELPLASRPTGPWLEEMLGLAADQLALYRRHPWLIDVMQRPPAPGPHTMDYLECCLRITAGLPRPTTVKLEAAAVVTGMVAQFARAETAMAGAPYPLCVDPARQPHLAAALTTPAPPPVGAPDLFDRALRAVLVGLLGPA